ncbi:MAG: NAD(P)(+) transhydrogenase (Re/Si-specific) subunit beta [Escherichia sp.]
MSGGLVTAACIVAAILFIFSLAGLSKHETSQQGSAAVCRDEYASGDHSGAGQRQRRVDPAGDGHRRHIGIRLKKVEMTEMPELVAILHSFVGLAVLVGFNSYLQHETGMEQILVNIHLTEVFLGIFIGAVTFTGSVVAFGKLCARCPLSR